MIDKIEKYVLEYKDYGCVKFKINKLMKDRKISVYQLSKHANIAFPTIKKLYEDGDVSKLSMDVVAKICYVLDCKITDIMEYVPPKK